MSAMEIHEDFMETHEKDSPSYTTLKKLTAEFRRGGRALKMNGLGTPERLPQIKTLRLCTVWSCVTGGETCKIEPAKWP